MVSNQEEEKVGKRSLIRTIVALGKKGKKEKEGKVSPISLFSPYCTTFSPSQQQQEVVRNSICWRRCDNKAVKSTLLIANNLIPTYF